MFWFWHLPLTPPIWIPSPQVDVCVGAVHCMWTVGMVVNKGADVEDEVDVVGACLRSGTQGGLGAVFLLGPFRNVRV